jgi:hypothetical protein
VAAPATTPAPNRAKIDAHKQRLTSLKGLRQPHETVYKECFEYCLPHLAEGWQGSVLVTAGDIQQRKARMLNGIAGESLMTSADGFMGGMTPANALWFDMQAIGRDTDEEKAWLSEASRTIWSNLHASNFDAEAYDSMLHLLGAGWFVFYVDEDDAGGYYCENWPIHQCYIASSRAGGLVDTIFREYPTTVGALVREFGPQGVSENVRQAYIAGKLDDPVTVLWVIEPRADYMPGAQMAQRMPYASCKYELATGHTLSEGGYHEFPCAVPRWRRIPGSVYAFGPMLDALADTKSANEVTRWEFAAAETVLAPPLKVVDDGVINARNIKLGPRKVIVCSDVNNIAPLLTGAKVEFGQVIAADLEQKVRRAMMADLFDKILSDPTMTATQVNAILGMIRQRMGPRFGRMQAEWLQALVERCYGIALRAGVLGQPPASLLRRTYSIKYLSPLARAQAMEEVAAIEAHEQDLMVKMAAGMTSMADTYEWDKGSRMKAEKRGVPAELLPDARVIAQRRAAAQQAAQAAQQQQIQTAAQAKGAEAMAEQLAGA